MDQDFLLDTETAKTLFHSFAESEPIFDWHCHLTAKEIYENNRPDNIYDLWLSGEAPALTKSTSRETANRKKNSFLSQKH